MNTKLILVASAPLLLTSCESFGALFSSGGAAAVGENLPQIIAGGSRILAGDFGGILDIGIAFSAIYSGIWGAKKAKKVVADRVINPKTVTK